MIINTRISKFLKIIFQPIILILIIIALWEGIRVAGFFDSELVPSSKDIFLSFKNMITHIKFWEDLWATIYRSFTGLFIALIIGIPVGLLIGSNRFLKSTGLPLVDFLRSIPVTALYPVFVLTLGIGDRGKIGMIFLGCVLIILLHAASGFDQRSRIRHQVSKLYGASKSHLLFKVSFFEALPNIITGTRVAIGIALIISTLTEMFMGASNGIGQSLMEAYSIYNLSVMYAYITALGLVGYAINRIFAIIETNANQWRIK